MNLAMTKKLEYPMNLLTALENDMHISKEDYGENLDASVAFVLMLLTDREQEVIRLYFAEGKTLVETGKCIGVGAERVRQILAKALRKLRRPDRYTILKNGIWGAISSIRDEAYKKGYSDGYALASKDLLHKPVDISRVSINALKLAVRPYNCITRWFKLTKDIWDPEKMTIDALVGLSEEYLRTGIRNMGNKSVEMLLEALAKFDIVLVNGILEYYPNQSTRTVMHAYSTLVSEIQERYNPAVAEAIECLSKVLG